MGGTETGARPRSNKTLFKMTGGRPLAAGKAPPAQPGRGGLLSPLVRGAPFAPRGLCRPWVRAVGAGRGCRPWVPPVGAGQGCRPWVPGQLSSRAPDTGQEGSSPRPSSQQGLLGADAWCRPRPVPPWAVMGRLRHARTGVPTHSFTLRKRHLFPKEFSPCHFVVALKKIKN